jgi:hypothetical protein
MPVDSGKLEKNPPGFLSSEKRKNSPQAIAKNIPEEQLTIPVAHLMYNKICL